MFRNEGDKQPHQRCFYNQDSTRIWFNCFAMLMLTISSHIKRCPYKPGRCNAAKRLKTKNWRWPDFGEILNPSATPKRPKTSLDWKVLMSDIHFQQSCYHVVQKIAQGLSIANVDGNPGFPSISPTKVINDRQPQVWWGNWYVDMFGVPANYLL